MPTLMRMDGLRVVIYPNDHSPPHVHVIGSGGEAIFTLHCPDGPPTLRECFGFSGTLARHIARNLQPHLSVFCDHWKAIHGTV